jgi:hypothetical protein
MNSNKKNTKIKTENNSNSNLSQSTNKKHKLSKNPILLIEKIIQNLKKKEAHKSLRFWMTNFFFGFLCLKAFQFSYYINEFSFFIPKEELRKNNMTFNTRELSKLDHMELIKYLDRLDKNKIDRQKISKGIEESLSSRYNNETSSDKI